MGMGMGMGMFVLNMIVLPPGSRSSLVSKQQASKDALLGGGGAHVRESLNIGRGLSRPSPAYVLVQNDG